MRPSINGLQVLSARLPTGETMWLELRFARAESSQVVPVSIENEGPLPAALIRMVSVFAAWSFGLANEAAAEE
jgi:hypothetical protein